LRPYSGRPENILKFSTAALDGLVALWDVQVSNFYDFIAKEVLYFFVK
jgi:hypothetical protein